MLLPVCVREGRGATRELVASLEAVVVIVGAEKGEGVRDEDIAWIEDEEVPAVAIGDMDEGIPRRDIS